MDSLCIAEDDLMHRFYADPSRSSPPFARLTPEDAHHALHVLRMHEGSPAEIICQSGRFAARIVSVTDGDVVLSLDKPLPTTETAIRMTLFQGIPKGDRMDLVIQKSVELGVSAIIPVIMSRCVARIDDRDMNRKLDRWRKIAREAGKQSGRCLIPDISGPVPLKMLSDLRNTVEELVIPWESRESYGPRSFFQDHPLIRSLGILIGPEGGIDPEEISFLSALPGTVITLGPRILRTETAGPAALSAFSALYGEME